LKALKRYKELTFKKEGVSNALCRQFDTYKSWTKLSQAA